MNKLLQPVGWARPRGYANGVAARGRQVFTAGQIGWNARCEFHTDVLHEQVAEALRNIVSVLAVAGGKPEHIVRLTWYLTNLAEYRAQVREIGAAYRESLGSHYPAMAVVQVVALVEERAKVEIEATAVIPDMGD